MRDEGNSKHTNAHARPGPPSRWLPLYLSLVRLQFLLGAFPAGNGDLLGAREGELARRRFLGDRAARADGRTTANDDRGHQHGVGTDEDVVLDHGAVLRAAVVVAGDRTGADIDIAANRRVTEIGKVIGL